MKNSLGSLTAGELRNLVREPELSFLLAAPFLIALLLRLGLPPLGAFLYQRLGFDLYLHLPFIIGFIMLVPPLLAGMVIGFRLIDDRDAGVLDYIAVTPFGAGGYIALRLLLPFLASIPLTTMLPYLQGELMLPLGPVLAVSGINALGAPLLVLFLVAFAGNKVEAMALAKISGILFLAPLAGYLLQSSGVYLLGIIPPFWTPLAIERLARRESYLIFLMAGVSVSALWLTAMVWIHRRRRKLRL